MPADTTDHCPPRSFFAQRIWPEGFEFPACASCNAAHKGDEQIVALLARTHLLDQGPSHQREWEALCDGVKNNHPEVVAEWIQTGEVRTRQFFRKAFGDDGDTFWKAGYGTISVGTLTRNAICRVLAKMGQAFYFRHTTAIFEGDIYVYQVDPFSSDFNDKIRKILHFAPLIENPQRSGKSLESQFQYRYNVSAQHGALNLIVRFSEQMLFQVFVLRSEMAAQLRKSLETNPLPEQVLRRLVIQLRKVHS